MQFLRASRLRRRVRTLALVTVIIGACLGASLPSMAKPKPQTFGTLQVPATAQVGEDVQVTAAFTAPRRHPRIVVLRRWTDDSWVFVDWKRQDSSGIATFSVRHDLPGRYRYRAVALPWYGATPWTTPHGDVVVSAASPDVTAPGPVSGVSVSGVTSESLVLSWTNPDDADHAGVMIRRAVGSTPPGAPDEGELVADQAAPGSSHTDTGLAAGTVYSYALFAHDAVPNLAAAATVTATTTTAPGPDVTAPGPVSGVSVSGVTSESLVLSWTNPDDADHAGVMIRRAVGSTPPGAPDEGELVADQAAPGSSHTDTGLAAGTVYSYALFAHDAVPNLAAAATVTATTTTAPGPDVTAPGPVSGVSVSGVTSESLVLSWTNPDDADHAGVMIRRAVGSTPPGAPDEGELVADQAAPGSSHTDTGLAAGTVYSYALFAHDAVPNLAAAATVTATTTTTAAPSGGRYVAGVSGNGRYFVDHQGDPILVKGDSPWAILQDASPTQMDAYVSTRATQGFNTVLLSLLGSRASGGPSDSGATYDGILPFVADNPARLNDAYWDRVEHFIAECRDAGITVMAYPLDGWAGTAESGGLAQAWSTTTAAAYGMAVAARLSAYPNVIWSVGGDYTIGQATEDARFDAVLTGLARGGMDRLSTIQFTLEQHQPVLLLLGGTGGLLLRLLLRGHVRDGGDRLPADHCLRRARPRPDGGGPLRGVRAGHRPLSPLPGRLGVDLRLTWRVLRP